MSPPQSTFLSVLARHLQTPFVLAVLAIMLYVLWRSQTFMEAARLFPQVIASLGVFLALLELALQFKRRGAREDQDFSDLASEDDDPATYRRGLLFFGWLIVFVALFFIAGPIVGAGLYVLALQRVQFDTPWRTSISLAGGLMALVWILGRVLQLRWPEPLLTFL